MIKIKRKGDLLTEEKRRYVISNIVKYFDNVRDDEIGIIAAEEILDFFLKEVSETIYNRGINDSQKVVNESFKDLEVDLDVLKFTRN